MQEAENFIRYGNVRFKKSHEIPKTYSISYYKKRVHLTFLARQALLDQRIILSNNEPNN